MKDFKDKTAIVTGAASGVGLGIARNFARAGMNLVLADIEEALASFRGTYLQQPPVFSAKKVDGDRAYDLARKHAAVALAPVRVTAPSRATANASPGIFRAFISRAR